MDKLKILIVEDNENDAFLEMHALKEAGFDIDYKRVETLEDTKDAMLKETWDCIITDFALGSFNGLDVLSLYKKIGLDNAFIMVSGTIGEETAVTAMKAGIHDYIMKDNLSRFVPALERELHEAKIRRQKKQAEADLYVKEVRFQALIEQAADAFFMHDFLGKFIEVNNRACESLGYSRSELLNMNVSDIDFNFDIIKAEKAWAKSKEGKAYTYYQYHKRKDGSVFPVELRLGSCEINKETFIVTLVRDITDIKNAENKILSLNRLYSTRSQINKTILHARERLPFFQEICKIVVNNGDFRMAWIGIIDEEKNTVTPIVHSGEENGYLKKFHTLYLDKEAGQGPVGISIKEGHSVICQDIETDDRILPWRKDALEKGYRSLSTIPLRCKNKIIAVLMVYGSEPNRFGKEDNVLLEEIGQDISFALDSMQIEEELKKEIELKKAREEQIRHSQKMEALGQLSGGIAHDFNNVMGIIVGSLELLETHIEEGNSKLALERLEKIIEVALRGSEITQRLLSFSRRKSNEEKEIIDPEKIIINLNEILQRLITDKELTLDIIPNSGFIQCNGSDFENAILNLCINSRDAMQPGGKIKIQLKNEFIAEPESFKYNLPIKPGMYIKVSVKDNGCGISEANMHKVFIPFFTTKPDGKGTGLGLANVYNLIEQSNGGIRIESTVNVGTEITLIFPQYQTSEKQNTLITNSQQEYEENKQKKILVVDDEIDLLELVDAILTFSGYIVIKTSNSNEVLDLLSQEKDIDLLLTDVLMPGNIDGLKLAEKVKTDFPNIKILLSSGFSKDLHKSYDHRFPVLQKPFRREELIKEVERVFQS